MCSSDKNIDGINIKRGGANSSLEGACQLEDDTDIRMYNSAQAPEESGV